MSDPAVSPPAPTSRPNGAARWEGAGSQWRLAAEVFEAIGPYALTMPWSLHGNPELALVMARERCLSEL